MDYCFFIVYYRHGLKQYRNGWADGPAYITQCPIQTGGSYTYDFNVTGQRGTLWWHAHILWLRATVYGAIVIMPKPGTPFPFPQPAKEFEIVLGQFSNFFNNLLYSPNVQEYDLSCDIKISMKVVLYQLHLTLIHCYIKNHDAIAAVV
jgi:hypothetical protein